MAARRITDRERRARLARRHHLARRASSVEHAAQGLVAIHSSDPATPYLSTRARVEDSTVAELEGALYDRRSLVRILGMRRTLFVVPTELAATVDAACTKALGSAERRLLVRMLTEQHALEDAARFVSKVEGGVLEALDRLGEATAGELTKHVPELGLKLAFGEGRKWAGQVGVSTRVLFLLATDGRIVRARPRGTWISSQYRWAATAGWLGESWEELEPSAARTALARRWLESFGPGTLTDLRWWTGWTVAATKAALTGAEAEVVQLDEGTGYVLPDDLAPEPEPDPWVALLPSLDSTVMGWKERGFYLGDHAAALFDRNGNAGPTVWADGRIVGGWGQRQDGSVAVRFVEDVGRSVTTRVREEVEALETFLGSTRVTPRFRTPLERDLSGG